MKQWPKHYKVFAGCFLRLTALAYAFFLFKIWVDTEFRHDLIVEAYGEMGLFELVYHSYQYLFWFSAAFGSVVGVFMFTPYSARLKQLLTVWTCFWIVTDIASAWLITVHAGFAWLLYASGVVLAVTFLIVYLMTQHCLRAKSETAA
ncbi:MAG: hypothetical protein KC649_02415 [Candidatus Omnitrophica bacterium]|nr:hypothetical protein [Candidatus Omnitrophota bacterium]